MGAEVSPRLQRHGFDLSDESLIVIFQKRADRIEHGVTEATDIHNVGAFIGLNGLVRLQVDADELGLNLFSREPALTSNEILPSRHDTR